MAIHHGSERVGLLLSPGPSSLGQAICAVAIVIADGAINDLADQPAAMWRPWLGAAVAIVGVHAIWEMTSTRRIVASPRGLHWSGGLSPSAGSVGWRGVKRIDALHDRFGSRWRIDVLHGPEHAPRLITLRGPGRPADLKVRRPEHIAEWWRAAGHTVEERDHPWGWRLESDVTIPPVPRGLGLRRRPG